MPSSLPTGQGQANSRVQPHVPGPSARLRLPREKQQRQEEAPGPSGRDRHRFQSLFIHKHSQSLRTSELNPPQPSTTQLQSPPLFRRKIEHLPHCLVLLWVLPVQSPTAACLQAGEAKGRLSTPYAGSAWLWLHKPPAAHHRLCSAAQLPARPCCQADAELSLAHADMIQEKRVQSIQCTGQRACADKCCPCGCGAGAARAAARAGAMRSTLVGHSRAQAWPSWPRSNKATAEEAPVGVGVPGASP